MAACFPLCRLPQKELSNVLLCMQTIDRLSYSLCSQKCKKRIVELNLAATNLTLNVGNVFSLRTEFSDSYSVGIETIEYRRGSILNLNAARNFRVTSFDGVPLLLDLEDAIDIAGHPLEEMPNMGNVEGIGHRDANDAVLELIGNPRRPVEENQNQVGQNMGDVGGIFENPLEVLPNRNNAPQIDLLELLGNQEGRGEGNRNANDIQIQQRGRHQDQPPQSLSWSNDNFSARDWIQHWMEIYHRRSIDQIMFYQRACRLDLGQLPRLLEDWSLGNLDIDLPNQRSHTQEILDLRLPASQLSITHESFQTSESVQILLIENLNQVTIDSFLELDVVPRLTLDDILLANTSKLHLM